MIIKEKTSSIIRSISGLVAYQGLVIGVSDEFEGLFIRDGQKDVFISLSDSNSHSLGYLERKKIKQDHESISLSFLAGENYLIVFPSLSKLNRNQAGVFKIKPSSCGTPQFAEKRFNLDQLFRRLTKDKKEINIEGHFFSGENLFLLSRGNETIDNQLICIENGLSWLKYAVTNENDQEFNYSLTSCKVDLGWWEGRSIHWTDGVYESPSNLIFLATIEKTENAYDDGDVLCSFIGRFDFRAQRVVKIKKILDFKKAEGLCVWNSRFLVSIDSDSPQMCNEFYSFPLNFLD